MHVEDLRAAQKKILRRREKLVLSLPLEGCQDSISRVRLVLTVANMGREAEVSTVRTGDGGFWLWKKRPYRRLQDSGTEPEPHYQSAVLQKLLGAGREKTTADGNRIKKAGFESQRREWPCLFWG